MSMQEKLHCSACMLTCGVPLIQPSAAALHPQQETHVSIHHCIKQVIQASKVRISTTHYTGRDKVFSVHELCQNNATAQQAAQESSGCMQCS